jgi:3-hydroxyisobutyrate dehydrogenase
MHVGFIGLGNMGLGMARNIAKAGHTMTVRDIRPEAAGVLAGDGARVAGSAAEAARDADLVCLSLFSEAHLRTVVFGADGDPGVLETVRPGAVITIHSTVSPAIVAELGAAAGAKNVEVLDVAMSGGGEVAANAGTLTFMVGGNEAAFGLCKPVLMAMASTIFYVGGLGTGMSAKIVSNFLLDANVTTVREGIRIAASAGIDEARILEIVGSNRMGSSWVSTSWEQIRALEESSWNGKQGVVDMYHKDLALALQLAEENGVHAPTLKFIATEVSPSVGENGLTR